jgi:hypothetical protein
VYDYLLGGNTNYAADRLAARKLIGQAHHRAQRPG